MKPAHKPKLPKGISFPVGYESIAKALAGVPFIDRIDLGYRGIWDGWIRNQIQSNQPYPLVIAEFRKWDKRLGVIPDVEWARRLYHEGAWDLDVYPVRSKLKLIANSALLEFGFPKLVEWLCEERPPGWYWGRKRCEVTFYPAEGRVSVQSQIVSI